MAAVRHGHREGVPLANRHSGHRLANPADDVHSPHEIAVLGNTAAQGSGVCDEGQELHG